jgi:5-methylcytosine-specific restriction endonuclease McrA
MKLSKEYKEFLASDTWEVIRKEKIEECGNECERCGETVRLQVHHRHYDMEFGKERSEDLMVLCKDCHNLMHKDLEEF